ncbi:MAG: kelch repeat-containing protein [Polyangiaceae bacterium]
MTALCAALPLFLIACSDDPNETDGAGASSSSSTAAGTGGGPGGAGGAGGSGGCPEGAHDEGGLCVATLGAWQTAPSMASARDHHASFAVDTAAGTFLYVMGGVRDQSVAVSSIERSLVGEGGVPGAWEKLPGGFVAMGPSVVVVGKHALLTGGLRPSNTIEPATDVVTVDEAGAISIADGPVMAHARFHHGMVQYQGWAWAVGGGGDDATSTTSVERIQIDESGPVGEWVEDTPLPKPRSHHAVAVHDGAIFAIAGLDRYDGEPYPYKDTSYSDIIRAPIGEDGALGEWATVGELPDVLAVHTAFVHLGQLYVLGGLEGKGAGGDFIARVQRATIAADGTVGAFEDLPSALPRPRGHTHQTPHIGNMVYSLAGADVEGVEVVSQTDVYFAPLE